MTGLILELTLVLAGFAAAALVFYRIPVLPDGKQDNESEAARTNEKELPGISVIIPARNEEANLPLLLQDLLEQTHQPLEIICVDDESEDRTGQIAQAFNTQLIRVDEKPAGWIGKSWACQKGSETATGDLLLFLDADVRLGRAGISRLMTAWSDCRCTVSVQPFHETREAYEQLSMMFNFLQLGSTGAAMPAPFNLGLYGPVILIPRADYWQAGGHEAVKTSVVEDVAWVWP